jgi:hypothetical protein
VDGAEETVTLRGVIILTMICTSGCGSAAAGDGSQPAAPPGQSIPSIITVAPGDREPGDGYPMRWASDLNVVARNAVPDPSLLPFNAAFPKSAGTPLVVFISDPATSDAVHSYLVDAEYDVSSPYGAFRLREERTPVGMLESDFVQSASHFCNDGGDGAGSGCTSTLIDIGSGQQGALLYGPNGDTSVTAVDSLDGQDYKLIVMGPGGSFTPDRAEAVIREVIAQFQP